MSVEVGSKIPDVEIMMLTDDGPAKVPSSEIFNGKTVVLFGVPGAFTPTCTLNHLPGFVENASALQAKGVDTIACMTVNDHHVTKAWAKQADPSGKLTYIADWDAGFAKALGLDKDLSAGGLGVRSTRFSMLVKDGKVQALNVEENPGKAEASSASSMLEILDS